MFSLVSVYPAAVFSAFSPVFASLFPSWSGLALTLASGVAGSGVYAVGELTGDCVNDGSLSTLYEQPASPQKSIRPKIVQKLLFHLFSPQYIYFHDTLQKIRLFPKAEENGRISLDFQILKEI